MKSYRAYGLKIDSEIELPELPVSESGGDVVVRRAPHQLIPPEFFASPAYFHIEPKEAILSFKQIGFFRIAGGSEIVVTPEPGADERLLQILVEGHCLAVLLYQRGLLVLHGSVAAIQGHAVALIGPQGAGKSAVAAALESRGHVLLSDDIGAIEQQDDDPKVLPGYPMLRITPELAEALGGNREPLVAYLPGEDVYSRKFSHPLPEEPVALRRIYLLSESGSAGVEHVPAQQAVVEIVRHSYPTRLAQPGGVHHFSGCVSLIRAIGLYSIQAPRNPDEVSKIAEMIEHHALGKD